MLVIYLQIPLPQVEVDEDDPAPEPDPTDTEEIVERHSYVEEMQAVLDDESGRPPVLDSVQVGTVCVTRWEGAVYRAVVLWVQHDYAKVCYFLTGLGCVMCLLAALNAGKLNDNCRISLLDRLLSSQ